MKLGEGGFYDTEIYDGSKGKFEGYVTSIAATDEQDVCCAQDYPFQYILLVVEIFIQIVSDWRVFLIFNILAFLLLKTCSIT